ncbi:MAG: hypothetical protein J6Y53_01155 [Alphaproteobacteria bacterium]|nr:hypothetical protein [Alphaproteobacteria bacterium]
MSPNNEEEKKDHYAIDKSKYAYAIDADDGVTQTVGVRSVYNGRTKRLTGLPKSLEVNPNTEFELCSSTKEYNNIDYLQVIQKDNDGNITKTENFERGADGKFKKAQPKSKSKERQYTLSDDRTYSL